ncbi:Gfo/Idh/MocA family protein [Oerskovia sp. NPDC060338]|uniref:Gfo/Idh/MocA family protein n=1 Tax=Oerskovia sp. NPDC060338 TaxID=3347100 RepID=UPI003666B182
MENHAIIGCGRVAPNHASGFGRVDGWAVSVVCDTVAPRAEAFAAEHGIPRATSDINGILNDDNVTSVSVTVDHASHAGIVEAALRAGKHVLVEKPFGLDPAEARRLVDLARAQGLTLSVVSQHRYDSVVVAIKEWMTQGLLGETVFVSASLQARREGAYYMDSSWRGTQAGEGGSALMNQGYHCLDTVRWLCGDLTTRAATARTVSLGGVIETEDTLCGMLTTEAGAAVLLSITVASSLEWRSRIEIAGTRGTVTFDLDHPGRLHHWYGSPELDALAEAENARSLTDEPVGISYYGISHQQQISDFCSNVSTGRPMLFDAGDSVGTLEAVVGLYDRAMVLQ